MVDVLQQLFWGWHVLLLILAAGAYFSWATGFYQLRCLGRWLRAALCPPREQEGITSFQALTAALAGSLGTGNIVGVGVALTARRPRGPVLDVGLRPVGHDDRLRREHALAARYRTAGAPGALGYLRRAGRWGRRSGGGVRRGVAASASLGMGNLAPSPTRRARP